MKIVLTDAQTVIVLVVGLLCYDRAGKQAQNMAGAVLVMEE